MNFLGAESGRDPAKEIARDFQLIVSVSRKRNVRAADDKAAKYNLDTRDQHMRCGREYAVTNRCTEQLHPDEPHSIDWMTNLAGQVLKEGNNRMRGAISGDHRAAVLARQRIRTVAGRS
jgi:hypothetical protein